MECCKLELCTKPCQMGKTEDILNKMVSRYHMTNNGRKTHLLEIVVTNKSLMEVKQWSERLNIKFAGLNTNIFSLSSKSNDFKNYKEVIKYFEKSKSREQYPNILIMCFHDTRVCKDIIDIVAFFSNNISYDVKFSITFDEPDVNMTTTSKFLNLSKEFTLSGAIERITFVTATPEETFWKTLSKHKIYELDNINREAIINFKDELINYRSINDHKFTTLDIETLNPLLYVEEIYATGLIKEDKPVIIFAPAHSYKYMPDVGSHIEFETFFLMRDYVVLVINGDFKGFKYPIGKIQTLDEYKKKYNLGGELRDILRHWKSIMPNKNLAITGNTIIERGLTFNTDGFNFTHAVFSSYHKTNKAKLVQMFGRTCGDIKYVNPIEIICPTDIKSMVSDFFKAQIDINTLNPLKIQRNDFMDTDKTVPVKLEFKTVETVNAIVFLRKYKSEAKQLLLSEINNKNIEFVNKNNLIDFQQILADRPCGIVRAYKNGDQISSRRFIEFEKAFNENTPYTQGNGDKYSISIDLALDDYIYGEYVSKNTTGWITFMKR